MQNDETPDGQEALALREAKKRERRSAMAELKRLHASDPEKAREAARIWFEQHAEKVSGSENSSFHQRKLEEADPARAIKAAEAARKREADTERAQTVSRGAVKEWRKKNPNKVKKLNNMYRERQKSK